MSEHMTPEQAVAELASGFRTRTPEYILDRAIRAMETLANMKTEAQYHRNYDTGRYERYTRTVGEWVKD